jgi:hypothetical protein
MLGCVKEVGDGGVQIQCQIRYNMSLNWVQVELADSSFQEGRCVSGQGYRVHQRLRHLRQLIFK